MAKESVPLLACPAVFSGQIEALLHEPAVAPEFFVRLLDHSVSGHGGCDGSTLASPSGSIATSR